MSSTVEVTLESEGGRSFQGVVVGFVDREKLRGIDLVVCEFGQSPRTHILTMKDGVRRIPALAVSGGTVGLLAHPKDLPELYGQFVIGRERRQSGKLQVFLTPDPAINNGFPSDWYQIDEVTIIGRRT